MEASNLETWWCCHWFNQLAITTESAREKDRVVLQFHCAMIINVALTCVYNFKRQVQFD